MYYIKPLKTALFMTLVLSLFVSAAPASAAEGIMISPVRIESLALPGEKLERTVKVTNQSDLPKTLYAYVRDFKADGEEGAAKLIVPGTGDETSLAAWIRMDTSGTAFGPNEEKEIPFIIEIPANAGPGGYYGAIVFGTQPPKLNLEGGEKGAAIAIAQQTGSLVLLQIAGDAKEEASIREFTTDKEAYSAPFVVNFMARVENSGNVHLKPIGSINIQNMFGQSVSILHINDKAANVLPSSIRKFTSAWKGDVGFGRYKATIALTYGTPVNQGGQGMQSLYQDKYFWIFPWKIIIPAFLGTIFFIALIVLFLKFYKSRAVKSAMAEMGLAQVRYVKKIDGPSPALHLGLMTAAILATIVLVVGAAYFLFFA